MNKEGHERAAELYAELASLAMKEKDYSKAEKHLDEAKNTIANT